MKFVGTVGFWTPSVEVKPGVFKPRIIERRYRGDILKDNRRFQERSDMQNDDLKLRNRVSILSDFYLHEHLSSVRYVVWNNVKWKVTDIDVNYPRVTLELGGVYNENTT